MSVFRRAWTFLHNTRKYWLMPTVALAILVAGLLVLMNGIGVSPIIYRRF